MKQILQNLGSGETLLADVPDPLPRPGHLLVQTRSSLVSIGTERMLVEFGQASLIQKARQQPDKVRQVIDKIRTDGLFSTIEAVRNKLDQPIPLGYCNAGVVIDASADGFKPGDRVASNGPHAELVSVPRNLCVKIPDGVSDESASFAVLSSIGLQGIRLAGPTLGEKFVVYGLGLIGLVTVQLLRAHGCEVLGIDVNPDRLNRAAGYGAQTVLAGDNSDPVTAVQAWTNGRGADGVVITASAKTDDIVHQAAQMCRKRGRIVLVGVVGLNLRRADFYEKELTFEVSCSYGPGRYDDRYEQAGHDYPLGYVRWTEQRNFEAVLEMIRTGRLEVESLVSHRFAFDQALKAYEAVGKDRNALGVILEYPADRKPAPRVDFPSVRTVSAGKAVVGVIGAGNFSTMTLMPALNRIGARVARVADLNGVAARHLASKYGAEQAVTDYREVLRDPEINTVFIAVGHHLHARFVIESLEAGKHTLVEKPLAMNEAELGKILEVSGVRCEVSGEMQEPAGAGGPAAHKSPPSSGRVGDASLPGGAHGVVALPNADAPDLKANGPGSFGGQDASGAHGVLALPNADAPDLKASGPGSFGGQDASGAHGVLALPTTYRRTDAPLLMVGFNRRFSPHAIRMRELLSARSEPLALTMTVNAGIIPPDHWVHDPVRGGGRIIGEACHFLDLFVFLTGSRIRTVAATMMGGAAVVKDDKMSIALGFDDGSVGTVNYFANGSKSYPKETLEVFSEGLVLRLENFRVLTGYGFRGFRKLKTWRQDKGHEAEFRAFIGRAAEGGAPLIPLADLVNVTRASFGAMESASRGVVVKVAG